LCEEATAVLEDVPESRTIGEDDMQLEVMIWYMISCGCGLILIRSVTL
jgi:hypothetical protein